MGVYVSEERCSILCHPTEPEEIKDFLKSVNINLRISHTLPFDYLVIYGRKRVAVERKEASDFIASIVDGRLWEQLYTMSTFCPLSYLVVIGSVTPILFDRKFPRSAYLGALVSATLKTSPEGFSGYVSLITLDTLYDFMEFLRLLCFKITDVDVRLPVSRVVKTDLRMLKVKTLSTFPGVGEVFAQELIKAFGSIYNVVNASVSELERVLGRKRAERVYRYVRDL